MEGGGREKSWMKSSDYSAFFSAKFEKASECSWVKVPLQRSCISPGTGPPQNHSPFSHRLGAAHGKSSLGVNTAMDFCVGWGGAVGNNAH